MTKTEIGLKAGEIFEFLRQNGECPLSLFETKLKGSRGTILAAVGWLAREGKLGFRKEGRTTLVRIISPG